MVTSEINDRSALKLHYTKNTQHQTQEKQLNQNAMVAYKTPQTILTLLTTYKIIAHKVNVGRGISHPCGNCMLYDQGEDGMIKKQIR